MTKQYAPRDIISSEEMMDHYMTHLNAMTGEDLHSKSAIAAELAWRDYQIATLRDALKYSSEYLYGSHLNSIGHGSKAHLKMVNALDETA